MGMAASQARFLSLTARLSNIEFEGQQINQARADLANKTQRAAEEYERAITNRRILFDPLRQVFNDENNYQVFDYNSIVNSVDNGGLGMRLVDRNGKVIVPAYPSGVEGTEREKEFLVDEKVYDSNYLEIGLREKGWNLQQASYSRYSTSWSEYDLVSACINKFESPVENWSDREINSFKKQFCDYEKVINMEETVGYSLRFKDSNGNLVDATTDPQITDEDYLYEKLISGEWSVQMGTKSSSDTNFIWNNTDWRAIGGIFDVLDTTDDAEAAAKYDRLTAQYQREDKQLELRLKQLDSEHNAVQTEYDAVKKVIDKNVETSFKTFG